MARTTSANPATPPSLHPVPEGVASPDGRWLFVPAVQGGLDAVATSSGELRWHRDDAALALLTDATRVLVLAPSAPLAEGRWHLQWRSADTGAPLATAAHTLPLPPLLGAPGAWAITATAWHPGPAGQAGQSGRAGRLWLAWSARQFVAGKPPVAHGVLVLDPARLDQAAAAAAWPAPPGWPGGPDDSPFAEAGPALPPWTLRQQTLALAVRATAGPGQRALVLLHAGAGGAAAASVLVDALSAPGWLQPLSSPDPGLVTLLHSQPSGGTPLWRLYSAPDGAALATVLAEDGLLPPFCRIGDVLLARQLGSLANRRARPDRQLRAWSLGDTLADTLGDKAGAALPIWQRALPTQSPLTLG